MKSLQRTLSKGRNNQRTAASTNRLLDALLMGDDGKDGSPNPDPNPSSNLLHNLYLAVPTNLEGKLLLTSPSQTNATNPDPHPDPDPNPILTLNLTPFSP